MTDQVSEPPSGELGVNTAANIVVEPIATVLDGGFTEILMESVSEFGKPPEHPVRPGATNRSKRAIRRDKIILGLAVLLTTRTKIREASHPFKFLDPFVEKPLPFGQSHQLQACMQSRDMDFQEGG
jgi:hypothetical protein